MEFFYPNDFIRFYNDEERDEVGEYEILIDGPFVPKFYSINDIPQSRSLYDEDTVEDDEDDLFREKDKKNTPLDHVQNAISDFPHNLMQTFPINLAASFIPTGQFGGQGAAPMGPPPAYMPSKNDKNVQSFGKNVQSQGYGNPQTKAVSGGSIRPCLYRYTYIWQTNGRSYWAYITRVDPRSISGWRWLGFRWVYFGVDTRRIDYFVCY